jgi:hypothetical protein
MYETQRSRQALSLVLALALSLWVQVGPATAETASPHHACHMGMSHSQSASPNAKAASHRCCPGLHSTPAPSAHFFSDEILCHQDCCTVGQQPERRLPFVANGNRHAASGTEMVAARVPAPPASLLDANLATSRPFARAVFDLKADLRI